MVREYLFNFDLALRLLEDESIPDDSKTEGLKKFLHDDVTAVSLNLASTYLDLPCRSVGHLKALHDFLTANMSDFYLFAFLPPFGNNESRLHSPALGKSLDFLVDEFDLKFKAISELKKHTHMGSDARIRTQYHPSIDANQKRIADLMGLDIKLWLTHSLQDMDPVTISDKIGDAIVTEGLPSQVISGLRTSDYPAFYLEHPSYSVVLTRKTFDVRLDRSVPYQEDSEEVLCGLQSVMSALYLVEEEKVIKPELNK